MVQFIGSFKFGGFEFGGFEKRKVGNGNGDMPQHIPDFYRIFFRYRRAAQRTVAARRRSA